MQNVLFSIIRDSIGEEVDIIDRTLITEVIKHENKVLALPSNLDVLRDISFFSNNQDEYHFVQSGEYLSFRNLNLNKPFVAYTKFPIGVCPFNEGSLHQIVAYKPVQ